MLKALKIVAKRQMSSCGLKLFLILVQYSLMKFKVSQYWSWMKTSIKSVMLVYKPKAIHFMFIS